jgi:hypothetical protein
VPDGVCVVWAGLLEKPLEMVCRWPRWTLVAVRGGPDAPRTRAARLQVIAVIVSGHGCSPLKAVFAPLVATFNDLRVTGGVTSLHPYAGRSLAAS